MLFAGRDFANQWAASRWVHSMWVAQSSSHQPLTADQRMSEAARMDLLAALPIRKSCLRTRKGAAAKKSEINDDLRKRILVIRFSLRYRSRWSTASSA